MPPEEKNDLKTRLETPRECIRMMSRYRRLKGLTQADLAERVELSRTHISNLEAPGMKTSISLEKLMDIADVLEVPVKKFFDFRDLLKRMSLSGKLKQRE